MQDAESTEYFQRRAEEERAAAERAGDERAARSHAELAERFDALAKGGATNDSGGKPIGVPAAFPSQFRILP